MHKVGIIILCRYNSSRLPGKILKKIEGKTILQHIVDRLLKVVDHDSVVIATSKEKTDDKIAAYCTENNLNCFRGSLENVAQRFYDAAASFNFDFAARINGDNVFVDIYALQEMIKIVASDDFDFVTNVQDRTFPFGMSIEIVNTNFYRDLLNNTIRSDRHKEHVTLYLYENRALGKRFEYKNTKVPDAIGLKLAIDEPKDFTFAQLIFKKLKAKHFEYDLNSLVNIARSL